MSAWSPSPEITEALDRVGVSYRKAGAANYVHAIDLGDFVDFNGPPRIRPRPHWRGSEREAMALLGSLRDDVGPEAFWRAVA